MFIIKIIATFALIYTRLLMKKFFTLCVLCCVYTLLLAQNRLVLVEEFTNSGCGPCATWSPVLDSAINYRLGDCIAIKYHSSHPDPNDEFYNYQPNAHQARLDFYHVTGVPTTVVNGEELNDRSFAMMNTAISYCMKQPAVCNLNVSKQLDGFQLSVQADLTPYNNIENGNVRLFVAAIEEHYVSPTAYSNGEREVNYTMRRMITPDNGYQLSEGTLNAGQTYTFTGDWTIDFFGNVEQLGVVAFLQDMETKEVLATAYTGPGAEGENQLALQNLIDTPDLICVPNFYGKVIFRNNGANALTSATLNVKVNGVVRQFPWTGHLEYLQRDTLEFENFTEFELVSEGKNQGKVWFTDVNGSEAVSNSRTFSFENSIQATYDVQLKIYTDKKPEEITWKLYDSSGDVVREGGPYTEPRKFVTENLQLTKDDCYLLEFLDAGGDGIKGKSGNGYFQLFQLNEEGKGSRIAQGYYEGAVFDLYFNLTGTPKQPRLVVFEEFTNTSCDPCADFSPSFDRIIHERMGEMVAITYHYNFPSASDPFYLANPGEVMTRAGFYGVSGVPSMFVLGEHVGSYGYEEYLDSYVDGARQTVEKVKVEAEATLNGQELTVDVDLTPIDVADDSQLRLFSVVVEERVEWDSPAANGERAWNYVMRKMLPNADGLSLAGKLAQVTPTHQQLTWNVENFTDETELGIVTFVQDMSTKELLGAVYTPRPTGSTSAAKILEVINTPDRICTPQFSSRWVVRNIGKKTLTQANLNVRVNGTVQTTSWTGKLEYLEIDTLATPMFEDFDLVDEGLNEVELWLSDLNGTESESIHRTLTLSNAHKAQHSVRLTLMTDNKPEEITWKLYDSAGEVVDEGGPYTEARKKQTHVFNISADDCYMLEFSDAGGNGITGENGRGYYLLQEVGEDGKVRLLVQADFTTAIHDVYFSLENTSATGIADERLKTENGESLYDLQGRRMSSYSSTSNKGVYILRQSEQTKKVIKN